eukprot:3600452-Alexandrium_andersonii.AAC.1
MGPWATAGAAFSRARDFARKNLRFSREHGLALLREHRGLPQRIRLRWSDEDIALRVALETFEIGAENKPRARCLLLYVGGGY